MASCRRRCGCTGRNIALKAQIDTLSRCLTLYQTKKVRKRVPLATRAGQVMAFLLTRDDDVFQNYYLSASPRTIKRWVCGARLEP
jgi:hypothetical protein